MVDQVPIEFRDWSELKRELESNEGVLAMSVETLRGLASEWQSVRFPTVRGEILERLDHMGASVWPDLPERRAVGTVLVCLRETVAYEVIKYLSAGALTPRFVRLLRHLNEPTVDRVQVARELMDSTANMIEERVLTEAPERARWHEWWQQKRRDEPRF
ncbi:hypothetical protein [Streptomyces sp. NPDC057686]|uniref:hypothetical protein n=1 Tax=Streptomyces sp. NPDC057686 TaxID=3346212 RepID=UPI003684324B